jgi:SAM-dependent MidA family methyltransferase
MAVLLDPSGTSPFDLVEAGAGDGRLSADILRALEHDSPRLLARTRLHLVESSASARAAQRPSLGELAGRLVSSDDELPEAFEGVLLANELLDALPVHQVVMREDGLREVFVAALGDCLRIIEGPPSTPALARYLDALGISMQPGWRAEISLEAVEWIRRAARRLRRGYIVLVDYGHEARELYSVTHAGGTLTTFSRHTAAESDRRGDAPAWLLAPGEQDITSHVDFTSVKRAAEAEGLTIVALLDQTYFLFGLAGLSGSASEPPKCLATTSRRRAFATLTMPGGLGSTMKVLILARDMGAGRLAGCSYKIRMT